MLFCKRCPTIFVKVSYQKVSNSSLLDYFTYLLRIFVGLNLLINLLLTTNMYLIQKRLLQSVLMVLLFLASCTPTVTPKFTFSPEMPRAGQTVTFTNSSISGEDWDWSFGDGTSSRVKNPTKTYSNPGTYNVTLRADSNNRFVVLKEIVVYDTIPTILASINGTDQVEAVNYYEYFTLSTIQYNPNSLAVVHEWEFSENAQGEGIVGGKSSGATVRVLFNVKNQTETVKLKITVGDSIYHITKQLYVNDIKARSILIADDAGKVHRQRLFNYGTEEATLVNMGGYAPRKIQNIEAKDNVLYVFDSSTEAGSELAAIEMPTGVHATVVKSGATSPYGGFWHGTITDESIFWTDEHDFIYKTPLSTRDAIFVWADTGSPYYVAKANRIGYFGNGLSAGDKTRGLAYYDNTYFWAKGNAGKGIYRFSNGDILPSDIVGSGVAPSAGAFLTQYAIGAFEIDPLNNKIYFIALQPSGAKELWVARLDGTKPTLLAEGTTEALLVDNSSGYVYFSTPNGVNRLRLLQGANVTSQQPEEFAKGIKAVALTIDKEFK